MIAPGICHENTWQRALYLRGVNWYYSEEQQVICLQSEFSFLFNAHTYLSRITMECTRLTQKNIINLRFVYMPQFRFVHWTFNFVHVLILLIEPSHAIIKQSCEWAHHLPVHNVLIVIHDPDNERYNLMPNFSIFIKILYSCNTILIWKMYLYWKASICGICFNSKNPTLDCQDMSRITLAKTWFW